MNKQMAKSFEHLDFDYVAGIEARGFVIAAGLASLTKTGFIPIRKKGKLPGATISQNYDLEYGTDTLEIHTGLIAPGSKILIVDDVLATGGTAIASINLINQAKLTVVGIGFLLEIAGLTGRKKIQETFPKLEVKVLI
jgi:adenine phosphoribosyltransferase